MKDVTLRGLVRAAVICLALQCLVACGKKEAEAPTGVPIRSTEGKFSIILPDSFPAPELSAKQVATEVGDITMHLYTSSKSDGSAFIISYNDYPDSAFVKETATMMDDIRDGALANMDAKLERQEDFTFEGHPARTFDFSLTSEGRKGYGRLQYCIARPRLYQIIFLVLDDQQERDADAIKRTFASFQLIK